MSESQEPKSNFIATAAFALALVATALGFGAYQRISDVALGLAKVEVVGATVTRKNLDAAHERLAALESRLTALEGQSAEAPPATETE